MSKRSLPPAAMLTPASPAGEAGVFALANGSGVIRRWPLQPLQPDRMGATSLCQKRWFFGDFQKSKRPSDDFLGFQNASPRPRRLPPAVAYLGHLHRCELKSLIRGRGLSNVEQFGDGRVDLLQLTHQRVGPSPEVHGDNCHARCLSIG